MSRIKTGLCALALVFSFSLSAEAALVSVRDNPDNGGSVFDSGLYRSVSIENDGSLRNVYAGLFGVQYGSAETEWTDLLTFCLQLTETLSLPKEHELVSGSDYFANDANRDALSIIFDVFMDTALGLKSATAAAAMQVMIWEIMEDGATAFDLSGGSFKVLTSDVVAEAESLWALLNSGAYSAGSLSVLSAPGTQDLLVRTSVPEPGMLMLMLIGAAGLQIASRRRFSTPG